jgi:hypothetical protein
MGRKPEPKMPKVPAKMMAKYKKIRRAVAVENANSISPKEAKELTGLSKKALVDAVKKGK